MSIDLIPSLIQCFVKSKRALFLDEIVFGNLKHLKFEKLSRWKPPREGWALLNTNRASKGNPGRAG